MGAGIPLSKTRVPVGVSANTNIPGSPTYASYSHHLIPGPEPGMGQSPNLACLGLRQPGCKSQLPGTTLPLGGYGPALWFIAQLPRTEAS